MKAPLLLVFISLISHQITAQTFTRKDSLQGSLRLERTAFDVLRYDLTITLDPQKRYLWGHNAITFKAVAATQKIQLDLFANMQVDSIVYQNKTLSYKREFNAVFIDFMSPLTVGSEHTLFFYYSGSPKEAKRAPWDGGFVYKTDSQNNPFIGVAVQGIGASLWYPVKDHQSDEPDRGASIKVAVPKGIMNVSNGRFLGSTDLQNGYIRWDWEVVNPINNYNLVINVADYVHLHDQLNGLDLDYYVLRKNETIARNHFEEVKPMLECFQEKFGPYPFIEDGFKLVETPYLGMEHQSAIAYGNNYLKGYMGNDMTGTGIGLLFDYITIHETGHEWFGNSITSQDIADMWIHESFTTYAESVFVECQFGYEKALRYINGQKQMIGNQSPVIGQFGVNFKTGNSDMYYKGALLLNTLRHLVNNDDKWWQILKNYTLHFRHQIITTHEVTAYFSKAIGLDLEPLFTQYLRHKALPQLEFRTTKKGVEGRWSTAVPDFNMPIHYVLKNKQYHFWISNDWKKIKEAKTLAEIQLDLDKMLITVAK